MTYPKDTLCSLLGSAARLANEAARQYQLGNIGQARETSLRARDYLERVLRLDADYIDRDREAIS